VRASRGRYVVMIDSDCVVEAGAVERMVRRHEQGEYAAVGGSIANGTPGSLSGTIGYLIEFREFSPSAPFRFEKGIPTANIAYRREVFDRHGYFDEDLWPAEDILFNWRLYEAGERLLFDPEIRAVHLNRTGWRDVLSHQVRLGATSALARKRAGLSGSVLLRFPALIILMPLYRLMKAARWFLSNDKEVFIFFLAAWPLYLLAALWWSWGFMRGALSRRER
jgi:GT2 family glycosyltransferase